jgi:hypothetical protein
MFTITSRYLEKHYDAESGETSGNAILLQICMRYQRVRFWWRWHREQPGTVSLIRALSQMARCAVTKATF